jgi:hypothetical protein
MKSFMYLESKSSMGFWILKDKLVNLLIILADLKYINANIRCYGNKPNIIFSYEKHFSYKVKQRIKIP